MGDRMIPVSFEELLEQVLNEYHNKKTLFQVPVKENTKRIPVGPAAGPHTQLAENIVAAYAAGAMYFELKTVQVLYGKDLGIKKPCIYAGHEVFNTEWSSELSAEEAANEYIKAFLLIRVLRKELNLKRSPMPKFILSVGYDLKGIQSKPVDCFLNQMQDATQTQEWNTDIAYLKAHKNQFQNLTLEDIEEINSNAKISDTVTLSTMHGCPAAEIEQIAVYLMEKKHFNTLVKLNPTLIGKQKTREILQKKGYGDFSYSEEDFDKNLSMDDAVELIKRCRQKATSLKKAFGVKMTNTFPVFSNGKMQDEKMYLSGVALYPLAMEAAAELAKRLPGDITMSYSGGADTYNITELLETGMCPITFSSVILKPKGYQNINRMVEKADISYHPKEHIDVACLTQLSKKAWDDKYYDKKETTRYPFRENYSITCAKCNNCVDVCPNRANIRIETQEESYVLHRNRLCNECGCCSFHCIMGHEPYLEKLTIYEDEGEYQNEDKKRATVLYTEKEKRLHIDGKEVPIPQELEQILKEGKKRGAF